MFYWIVKAVLAPILHLVWRPKAEGVENVPRDGPAILACNHLSFADHFFGPLPVPRRVTFLAKAEYFTGKGLKGLLIRAFFSGVGQVPVNRTGGRAGEEALRAGLRVLAKGRLLGIYPEGTRAPDNRLYRGRTGVARLALESGAPVVPMAVINTFELMPAGRMIPRLRPRPGVRFGRPLDFSRYRGLAHDRAVLRGVTDEIMYSIRDLSGQEYVDRYATDVKKPADAAWEAEREAARKTRDESRDETREESRDESREEDRRDRAEVRGRVSVLRNRRLSRILTEGWLGPAMV